MIFLKKIEFYTLLLLMALLTSFTPGNKKSTAHQIKSIRKKIYSFPKKEKNFNNSYLIFDELLKFKKDDIINQSFLYKSDTIFSYTDFYYDTANLLTESREFNADNTIYLTIKFTHDKKGFTIRADYLRTNQKLYDSRRNPVEVEFEAYYKKLFTYVIYVNDFMGNVIEAKYFTADHTLLFKYTYQYDYKYHKTEIKYYNSKGSVSWRKKIKYNKRGLPSEYKLFMSNRPAMSAKITYTLNSYNDWTQRKETRKLYGNFFASDISDNTLITTRDIEYY